MNYPNEIFTYPVNHKTKVAKENIKKYYCRFIERECDKQSRTIKYPMGVCSVSIGNNKPIICPHRFLEDDLVFQNICKEEFGTLNNILLFPEVKLNGIGTFDFVLVKHKPISNKVDEFCVVEFQSDSTTGTGKLVNALKDFMDGYDVTKKNYSFGMNTYNTIKLSYIQMLIKGQVMESWNKNAYWIMQEFVFDNMANRFHLENLDFDKKLNTHYYLYDLIEKGKIQRLEFITKKSTSVNNLLTAFTHQPIPNIDNFVKKLEEKIKLKVGLLLE